MRMGAGLVVKKRKAVRSWGLGDVMKVAEVSEGGGKVNEFFVLNWCMR